eukprot:TRINITY_DN6233_c0_g1_i1.p1 TRINITY_DN6233_c0_g1~~TRINITY_DN6233_c0_g1_i1.p1  ORF type:complete len:410 (+),score=111.18 TRINITY_DN6233_c0_g1_i1:72-1301(+)
MSVTVGDLCWAKVHFYPFWPAKRISHKNAPDRVLASKHQQGQLLVRFYGSTVTYGWINKKDILPFRQYFDEKSKPPKDQKKSFLKAIEQAAAAEKRRQDGIVSESESEEENEDEKGQPDPGYSDKNESSSEEVEKVEAVGDGDYKPGSKKKSLTRKTPNKKSTEKKKSNPEKRTSAIANKPTKNGNLAKKKAPPSKPVTPEEKPKKQSKTSKSNQNATKTNKRKSPPSEQKSPVNKKRKITPEPSNSDQESVSHHDDDREQSSVSSANRMNQTPRSVDKSSTKVPATSGSSKPKLEDTTREAPVETGNSKERVPSLSKLVTFRTHLRASLNQDKDLPMAIKILENLKTMTVTIKLLKDSRLGRVVMKHRDHKDPIIAKLCDDLYTKYLQIVEIEKNRKAENLPSSNWPD